MDIFAEVVRPLFYDKPLCLCSNAQRGFKCNALFIFFKAQSFLKASDGFLWDFLVCFVVSFPSLPPSPLSLSSNQQQ